MRFQWSQEVMLCCPRQCGDYDLKVEDAGLCVDGESK